MRKHTRRGVIATLFGLICAPAALTAATKNSTSPQRVQWKKLTTEHVQLGDMWASYDPNTPERQAESNYNLLMQAAQPDWFGTPANKIGLGNGGFWRPVAIVSA